VRFLIILLLCGCSSMTNYTASIDGHEVDNKQGALLSLTKPDGTVIVSDDREVIQINQALLAKRYQCC